MNCKGIKLNVYDGVTLEKLPHVVVKVRHLINSSSTSIWEGMSDWDGEVEIPPLPCGYYIVEFVKNGYVKREEVLHSGLPSIQEKFWIYMTPIGIDKGRMVQEVHVIIFGGSEPFTVYIEDLKGKDKRIYQGMRDMKITDLEGDKYYFIWVKDSTGLKSLRKRIEVKSIPTNLPINTPREELSKTKVVKLHIGAGRVLVTMKDPQNNPIPHATIWANEVYSGFIEQASTDETGMCYITLPYGTWKILAEIRNDQYNGYFKGCDRLTVKNPKKNPPCSIIVSEYTKTRRPLFLSFLKNQQPLQNG